MARTGQVDDERQAVRPDRAAVGVEVVPGFGEQLIGLGDVHGRVAAVVALAARRGLEVEAVRGDRRVRRQQVDGVRRQLNPVDRLGDRLAQQLLARHRITQVERQLPQRRRDPVGGNEVAAGGDGLVDLRAGRHGQRCRRCGSRAPGAWRPGRAPPGRRCARGGPADPSSAGCARGRAPCRARPS